MKQYLVMIGLFICLSLGGATADQNMSVYERTLQKMADSVLQVTTSDFAAIQEAPFSTTTKLSTGTGFVVFSNDKMTLVVTAKHVVSMEEELVEGVLKFSVKFNDKQYFAEYATKSPEMDAAYLVFEPAIPGVKVLDMELSDSDEVTEALAFGYGQSNHIKGQKQTYTFTHGYVSRKVCTDAVFGKENELNKNIIYGTPTIIFGYSGGPLVDTNMRLLGISVAMTSQANIFVDIRAVYNWMNHKFGSMVKVKIPYDLNFEIFNRPGKSRMGIGDETKARIESSFGNVSLRQLRIWMNGEASKNFKQIGMFRSKSLLDNHSYNWVEFGTLITIGDKSYKLRRVFLAATPIVAYRYENAFAGNDDTYLYMCDKGWEVIIGVVEVTDKEEIKERRNLHKVQMERRLLEAKTRREKEKAKREAILNK